MDFEITTLSVGRFAPTLILFALLIYLIQRKQKDLGTFWFILYFFFLTLFNIGYIIGYSINNELGRYGWYIACSVVFAAAARLQISFTFPTVIFPQVKKYLLVFCLLFGVLASLDYFFQSGTSTKQNFLVHSYGSKYVSVFIPLFSFLFYLMSLGVNLLRIIGILRGSKKINWQSIRIVWSSSSEMRITTALFFVTLAEITLTILYLFAVNQLLKTSHLAEILNFGGLMIFVCYSFVYASWASGRTGIITRLVGISLVTFLVILHFVTRFYQEQRIGDYYQKLSLETKISYVEKNHSFDQQIVYTLDLNTQSSPNQELDRLLKSAVTKGVSDGKFRFFNFGPVSFASVEYQNSEKKLIGFVFYDEYRKSIHKILSPALLFYSLITILILFVFPLLFRANFIIPLNNLMKDLSELSPKSTNQDVDSGGNEIFILRKTFEKMAELIHKTKIQMPEVLPQIEILSKILNSESQKIHIGNQTLVYRSSAVRKTLEEVSQASRYRYPILITGETGTGKELISRLIHESSEEAKGPYVAINCATIPENLWESEIFGHKKGSFTDAKTDRKGRVAEANSGSLFFDEIGEMPINIQAKMLRLLQDNTYNPLGSDQTIFAECRFIFATNRNLDDLVRQKLFREDLLYRIRVFPIELPALRERIEDIPHLIRFFVDKFAEDYKIPAPDIDQTLLQRLIVYPWPGNIREMENRVIHAMARSQGKTLTIDHFENLNAEKMGSAVSYRENLASSLDLSFDEQIKSFSKNLIESVYRRCGGNITQAAKVLSMKRTTLRYQLIELGILGSKSDK